MDNSSLNSMEQSVQNINPVPQVTPMVQAVQTDAQVSIVPLWN